MSGAMSTDLGARIRAARLGCFLSQAELAAHLHVARGTVARWETGMRAPSIAMLHQIAAALHTTVAVLAAGASSTPAPTEATLTVPRSPQSTLHPLEHESIERLVDVLVAHPEVLPTVLTVVHAELAGTGASHDLDRHIARRLQQLDIDHVTPVDALALLAELRALVRADPHSHAALHAPSTTAVMEGQS